MTSRFATPLFLLATACSAVQPSVPPAPAYPTELQLADGSLRIVNLYRLQGKVLQEGSGQPADTLIDRLVREVYVPYSEFWNGYLGDESAFRKWAPLLLDPAHPIHARLAPLEAVALDRRFTEGAEWITRTTGRKPEGTWYIVFGPGWTDMGGLGAIGMVADFTVLEPDSARIAGLLPHELTHQVHGAAAATDPDAGTVLHRIVSEGFASYVAWVYGRGAATPAEALMYTEAQWDSARAYEPELVAAVRPILDSRERKDLDLVASRGNRLIPGTPTAAGYFIGFRIAQAYVANRGPDSWKEIYDLPAREVVRRSGWFP
jgi:hypothetical protein